MLTLVKQELFKLMKKRSTWIATGIMLVIQIGLAFWSTKTPSLFGGELAAFQNQYFGEACATIFLIAATATIITMEFQYGTIQSVLYRQFSRATVLISKWLTILVYSIYWAVLSWGMAILLRVIFVSSKVDLGQKVRPGVTVLQDSLISTAANWFSLWLIISVVFLLANIFKTSAAAVSVGIIGYFVTGMISTFLVLLVQKWEWTKWNPIMMLFYPASVQSSEYEKLIKLTTTELFWGNVGWIAFFLALGYFVFQRRNV